MGCRLVQGETVYFVRHAGRTSPGLEGQWFGDEKDTRLLPRVYTHSDGMAPESRQLNSVVPIEVQCFEFS